MSHRIDEQPKLKPIRAIDVIPHQWALWCRHPRGNPFANTIVHQKWTADGRIAFMVETHNFFYAEADEVLELVEETSVREDTLARARASHAEFLRNRPEAKP